VFPDFLDAFSAVFRCSVSPETLRSLPPFITFALHENRAFPYRTSPVRPSSSHGHESNDDRPKSVGRDRSSSRVSPFNPPITPSIELSRYEVGVNMLQLYSELLCEANNDLMSKFSKAVSTSVSGTGYSLNVVN
jgi:beige protein homolog 1